MKRKEIYIRKINKTNKKHDMIKYFIFENQLYYIKIKHPVQE